MRITRIKLYQTSLPYIDGEYAWGNGNVITDAVANVVVVDTDAGISGCGEFTPCGENYMEAHSQGVEGVLRMVASALVGTDPRQVGVVEQIMDHTVRGHGYAKAPVDAACWDILGKATGQPVWMLLGGRMTNGAPMYRVAPQRSEAETRAELARHRAAGYRQFQIKVGADWAADVNRIRSVVPLLEPGEKAMVDANQGWRVDDALRVARATRDLDYILEQPCQTYAECLQVRARIDHPMKLDECVTGIEAAQQIVRDSSAETVCLKISNLGGLSKARRVRDYLVANRIPVVAEDSWGGEITSSAVAHFAASTPSDFLVNSTDLHNYVTRSTGTTAPPVANGKLFVSDDPGLGTEANLDSLGDPVAVFGPAP